MESLSNELLIGICVLGVVVFCLSVFIAYWLLVKRKMAGWLRSLCKCFKSDQQKGTNSKAAQKRKMSLVIKAKPEIRLVEGSLQSTSQQVPEEFRQKLDSDSEQPPNVVVEPVYAMPNRNSQDTDAIMIKSSGTGSDTGSTKVTLPKYERSVSSLSRQRPKVAAPPAPVKKFSASDDNDTDDVEIIDNDIYGAA